MKYPIEIEVLEGPHIGKRLLFVKGPIRIGRGDWPQVALDQDLGISREHLIIRHHGRNRIYIQDRSSTGTFVDERRLRKAVLPSGSTVRLGENTVLRICVVPEWRNPVRASNPGRGLRLGLPTVLAVAVGMAVVLLISISLRRCGHDNGATRETIDPRMLIEEARIEEAMTILRERIRSPESATDLDEALFSFGGRLRRTFGIAQGLEARFQPDAACDRWRMIVQNLKTWWDEDSSRVPLATRDAAWPEDWPGLRRWIEDEKITPLEERISNVQVQP